MLERRNPGFARISPEVGRLDETALGELISEDLDRAAALLADMSVAVDDRLRSLAQALAARTFIRLAAESGSHREARRLTIAPYEAGGDLDLDRTLDRSGGLRPRNLEELVTRAWGADRARIVLLVDRSGSMSGGAVARAATAAAAIALGSAGRADCGVVAFARDRIVLSAVGTEIRPAQLVVQILSLRGHGTTDVAGALGEAATLLAGAPTGARRTVVLLSDCQATEGPDPVRALRGIDRLHVVLPGDDPEWLSAARRLAGPSGGRVEVAATLAEVARVVPVLLA